jgi:hypothetical protein
VNVTTPDRLAAGTRWMKVFDEPRAARGAQTPGAADVVDL